MTVLSSSSPEALAAIAVRRDVSRASWAFLLTLPLGVVGMVVAGMLPADGIGALLREPAGKIGLLLILAAVSIGPRVRERLRLAGANRRALGLAALCGFVYFPLSQAVAALACLPLALAGAHLEQTRPYAAMQTPLGALVGVLLVLFGVAVEELFFRGYMLTRVEGLGARRAILLTSVLFGLVHMSVLMLPGALILGLYTANMAWRSRSVLPGVVAHGVGNTLGILVSAWPQAQAALVTSITTPSSASPSILLGSLVLTVGLLGLLMRLLRAFDQAVAPVSPNESEGALGPVLAGAIPLWIYALLYVGLNVMLTKKMFRP